MIVIFNVLWTIFIGVKIPLESIQLNGLEIRLSFWKPRPKKALIFNDFSTIITIRII